MCIIILGFATFRWPNAQDDDVWCQVGVKSARGAKHLRALSRVVGLGHRAGLLYLVQRTDCDAVTIAADIDPAYAASVHAAQNAGVRFMAIECEISPSGVSLRNLLPFMVPPK